MTDKEKELIELIKNSERISVFDIPSKFLNEMNNLISKKKIIKKLYCYDTEYKEHLSTYYLQLTK